MLYALKILVLTSSWGLFCGTHVVVPKTVKPDLQKVYEEALRWSKIKLEQMPTPEQQQTTSSIGVCKGKDGKDRKNPKNSEDSEKITKVPEILTIAPGCHKKNQKKISEVLDQVMIEGQGPQQGDDKSDDKILVFVSFSMPKASLLALSQEAEKYQAVLVMRGLRDDSFKATQSAFQELGGDMQSGIEINPEAFETYQIKQVPVFVRVKSTPAKETKELGRLSGNVSLAFAAQKLRELSE